MVSTWTACVMILPQVRRDRRTLIVMPSRTFYWNVEFYVEWEITQTPHILKNPDWAESPAADFPPSGLVEGRKLTPRETLRHALAFPPPLQGGFFFLKYRWFHHRLLWGWSRILD